MFELLPRLKKENSILGILMLNLPRKVSVKPYPNLGSIHESQVSSALAQHKGAKLGVTVDN